MEVPLFTAPSEWTTQATVTEAERNIIQFPEVVQFCRLIQRPTEDVKVIKRIGSESTEGEVYQIEYQGQMAAIKLMPINSDQDRAKNQTEMEVAQQVSQMVADNECSNFPMVFEVGRCQNVWFFRPEWRKLGEQYACLKYLQSLVPTAKAKQLAALYRQGLSLQQIADRFNLDLAGCHDLPVACDFMISELAHEDLSSWAQRPHSVAEWKNVIYQILAAIVCLHTGTHMIHGDLHWGNILIKQMAGTVTAVPSQQGWSLGRKRVLALLHDFGKSEPLTATNHQDDIIKFCAAANAAQYQLPIEIKMWFQQSERMLAEGAELEDLQQSLFWCYDTENIDDTWNQPVCQTFCHCYYVNANQNKNV